MLVVWVFGCPLIALFALYKNRHRLNDTAFQRYFIVLYQGLKDEKFYWEVVNTTRKVLIVSINVFLSGFSLFYKGAAAIILLLIFIRVQIKLEPFKLYVNNEWELLSFMASMVTLYGGLLYVSDEKRVEFIDVIAFIIILVINIYFILLWVYLMSYTMHRFNHIRKFTNFMQIILCRKKDSKNVKLITPGTLTTSNMNFSRPSKTAKRKLRKHKKHKRLEIEKMNKQEEFKTEEDKQGTPKRSLKIRKGRIARDKERTKSNQRPAASLFASEKTLVSKVSDRYANSSERELVEKMTDRKRSSRFKDYAEFRKQKLDQNNALLVINEEDSFFHVDSSKDNNSLKNFKVFNKRKATSPEWE